MRPFAHRRFKIQYDDLISDDLYGTTSNNSDESSNEEAASSHDDKTSSRATSATGRDELWSGGEGHVFKVRINSRVYALKLFKFFDISQARCQLPSMYSAQITDDEIKGHLDPFYAECRAYGAIEERLYNGELPKNEDDWIAAPCYGYLRISVRDEDFLRETFKIRNWDRANQTDTEPIRGLVKEFIEEKAPVNTKRRSVRKMRKDLLVLESIGVYPRDIAARNYRAGLLVDFGHSYTDPHCVLSLYSGWKRKAEKSQSLSLFDKMIQKLKIRVSSRDMPRRIIYTRSETSRRKQSDLWELDSSGYARRAK
ncbi:hypothetical protein MPH_12722 [Macrophomina phaseolina MS6]|uniref:Uncharacterized protein n=1 Tax=Macrophomina phaseolina (strain MS6) TaxID=1126212 RepID=K2RBA3_MACPH|nr:hypothetical protein MPH_12722 [Macrophomina phaseolina MS6]